MALFKPKPNLKYKKEEIVSLCLAYINSSEFRGNVTEKEQKINLIKNKQSEYLEFNSRGKGWGSSALNPNCWIEIPEGKDIEIIEIAKSKGLYKSKASPSQYNTRPWQGKYRSDVLRIWKVCAITSCETPSLLTASHIKPVIYCTTEEMTDPFNAILLSKVYDKLFDSGLISFEADGKILVSKSLPTSDLVALNIDIKARIQLDPRQLPYLNFHRTKIFKNK